MITGIYIAAAGMASQMDRQDTISNNLANCNSPGFKRSEVGFSAYSLTTDEVGKKTAQGRHTEFTKTTGVCNSPYTLPVPFLRQDRSQGLMEKTNTPAHLAIDGAGCFVVRTPQGDRLSRNGSFRVSDSGELVTQEGYPVLGQDGAVHITGSSWGVEPDGSVKSDGVVIDRLQIRPGPGDPSEGDGFEPGRVIQGALESSNANPIREMVQMISGVRAYEAGQRLIQALDQTLDKAINQLGRTA